MPDSYFLVETVVVNKFFDGYKRTSFRFNNGWKDEDEHDYVGKFRILKAKKVFDMDAGTSNGEADGRIFTVLAPKGASIDDVINVLDGVFSWHCRCEHDCCGHMYTGVMAIHRTKKREWLVEQVRRYNV